MLYGHKIIVKEILFRGCFFAAFRDSYPYLSNVNDAIFVSIPWDDVSSKIVLLVKGWVTVLQKEFLQIRGNLQACMTFISLTAIYHFLE